MRYIVIEKNKGIFLGSHKSIQVFSNELIFPIVKACSFSSLDEVNNILGFIEGDYLFIAEIDYHLRYVPIDILIKSGYSDYIEEMLLYLPVNSFSIH